MRDLSIQDVIKAVPMEEDLRKELLEGYDSFDESKQFEIVSTCWDAFYQMEEILKSYHEARIMQEVSEGTLKVDTISDAVQEAVEKDIEDRITGKKADDAQLDTVRHHLEKLMNPPS